MSRTSITIRVRQELIDRLDAEADEIGVSRSEHVRQILEDRHEADELRDEIETLRERLDAREERIDELERQLARRSEIEEKVDTLAKREEEPDPPFFVKWARWFRNRE